ncbi:heavy metal translocating P-type ATPase [Halomicrobium salinisoli]|uniref:heavy metal translocating P-type ATPase n=1 Tax=Halomicrobium salinisoli TaxID=2878391 RepID=UPI001CF026B6|nr:cation-translocating P-type ATPase [Halomicrobium salinisoli]
MTTAEPVQRSTCTLSIERRGGRSESGAVSLERRLADVAGVHDVDVSFQTGSVRISYDESVVSEDELRRAVRDGGATLEEEEPDEARTRSELRVEAAFVGLTLLGMVGGLVAGWLDAPASVRWVAYGGAYVFGGWYGLQGAVETLRHRAVDIDLLMIVAAVGALLIGAPFEGAMLLFLFSLSNTLQHYAIGRSRRAIRSLVEMRPESARVLRDGEEVAVPIDQVEVGDVFVVRPGDRIPLDGAVVDGESTVDQASLTGESVPVAKAPGDEVFGGTINESGSLEIEVTREAHESAITRLIHMVEEAQSEKAPTQRLIDRLEQPYVLGVFALTAAAVAVPMLLGAEFSPAFYRAMTLMVAASPCAVIISTPAAVLSAIASGGRQGVLFKGGEHVETAAEIDAVAFDKTGTLTEGDTRLTDVIVRDGAGAASDSLDEDRLLRLAAAVQARSEHHLAEATVEAADDQALDVPEAVGFQAAAGKGVRATVAGDVVHVGNRSYVETFLGDADVDGLDEGLDRLADLEAEGKTAVLVVRESDDGTTVIGWLAFTDTVRPGAAEMIAELRDLGVEHVVMLTGDNERVARRIADEVGIDEVQAELLPEEKVDTVEGLVDRYENVAMVGDGVNDAPALATATLGVAMGGAGTDVALETADVVLMGDDITKVPYVLGLGRRTRRTLSVNLAIAFGAIVLMVGTILLRGIPLPLAVVGHEGSTVLVSLNGLRLLGYRD